VTETTPGSHRSFSRDAALGCLSRNTFDSLSPRLQAIAIELSKSGEFEIEGLNEAERT